MGYTVVIFGIGRDDEIEWEEQVTSEVSMTGARRKATNWINKNLFADEIEITKKENGYRDYWYVR